MLMCTIVAGSLFLSQDWGGDQYNFGYIQNFSISRGKILTVDYGDDRVYYDLPPQWQGQPADAVINACAEEARSLTITQDQ